MTDHLTAYARGFEDRTAGRPMVESWTLPPADANSYVNGYRAACERLDTPLHTKIAAKRAQLERERREILLGMGVYFHESAEWWFAEAANAESRREAQPCRAAALASATASHLAALTLITLENTP